MLTAAVAATVAGLVVAQPGFGCSLLVNLQCSAVRPEYIRQEMRNMILVILNLLTFIRPCLQGPLDNVYKDIHVGDEW